MEKKISRLFLFVKFREDPGESRDRLRKIPLGRLVSERESQRPPRRLFPRDKANDGRKAFGREAGALRRNGHSLLVERDREKLPAAAGNRDVHDMGDGCRGIADDNRLGNSLAESREEALFEPREARPALLPPRRRLRKRLGESGGERDTLGSRARSAFLSAAEKERSQGNAAPPEEESHPFGTPDLLPVESHEIDEETRRGTVKRERPLARVRVKKRRIERHPPPEGELPADRGDRLNRAEFVVDEHEGDEGRLGTEGAKEGSGGDDAAGVRRNERDGKPPPEKLAGRGEEGRVLDRGENGVGLLPALRESPDDAEESQVVRLGRGRGENDLVGADPEGAGGASASAVELIAGGAALRVRGERIPGKLAGDALEHPRDRWIDRSRRRVVEVNAAARAEGKETSHASHSTSPSRFAKAESPCHNSRTVNFALPLDPVLVALAAAALAAASLLATLALFLKIRRFMRGRSGESLEGTVAELLEREKAFATFEEEMRAYLKGVERRLRRAIRGVATVRFNPFKGTGEGGQQSFSTAFLSEEGDGVVFTGLWSRERMSVFAKPVAGHASPFELTGEEREALASSRAQASGR